MGGQRRKESVLVGAPISQSSKSLGPRQERPTGGNCGEVGEHIRGGGEGEHTPGLGDLIPPAKRKDYLMVQSRLDDEGVGPLTSPAPNPVIRQKRLAGHRVMPPRSPNRVLAASPNHSELEEGRVR